MEMWYWAWRLGVGIESCHNRAASSFCACSVVWNMHHSPPVLNSFRLTGSLHCWLPQIYPADSLFSKSFDSSALCGHWTEVYQALRQDPVVDGLDVFGSCPRLLLRRWDSNGFDWFDSSGFWICSSQHPVWFSVQLEATRMGPGCLATTFQECRGARFGRLDDLFHDHLIFIGW